MHKLLTVAGAAFALTACATTVPPPRKAPTAGAEVRDSAGRVVARAMAAEREGSVSIRVEAAGLAPGTYGVHVHAVGRCDAPGFTTAGPHWNPDGRQHGRDNPQGMHKGDLPNLVVGADGRGTFDQTVPMASLTGGGTNALLDADGAAVVIHAQSDDYRTDPSGNSGARIACGVLAGP
jgi:Cu-Zn family superoxide dismutase